MRARMRHCAIIVALAAAMVAPANAAEKGGANIEIIRGPYLIADAETGQVIEEFDAMRPWYPASTTKLMTIYVTFQAVSAGELTLDTEIKYSRRAAEQPPSKMGFKSGSTLTLDNALKIMMVKSANDVAVAVAEAVGGSVEGFAERMNAYAEKLGMTRSHFVNPHGLPDQRQVTSARDMALLAQTLLNEFPEHRPYYAIHAIQYGNEILKNHNRLVDRYPGTTGMKTGFICASGYNLVASARRDGRELIAVVFGAYAAGHRNERAAELLDSAFEAPSPVVETEKSLPDLMSGARYTEPYDMRPHVCTSERVAALALLEEDEEDGDAGPPVSHLTFPTDLGPPIRVTANVPVNYGEPGFVAPMPRPRPAPEDGPPEVLPAFAPLDDRAKSSAPAEAIGTALGEPKPLDEVTPQ